MPFPPDSLSASDAADAHMEPVGQASIRISSSTSNAPGRAVRMPRRADVGIKILSSGF
jgi:hypothetical protein